MVAEDKKTDVIDALFEVYNSFISPAIDDYNSSFYYENRKKMAEILFDNLGVESLYITNNSKNM